MTHWQVCVGVWVCVCVRERERERERHGKRDGLGERERDVKREMLLCLDFTEQSL